MRSRFGFRRPFTCCRNACQDTDGLQMFDDRDVLMLAVVKPVRRSPITETASMHATGIHGLIGKAQSMSAYSSHATRINRFRW